MTADREAIRQRAEKATKGPWTAENAETREDGSPGNAWGVVSPDFIVILHDFVRNVDAEFIAHAREDIPALLAALDVLEAERDRLRVMTDRWDDRAEDATWPYGQGISECADELRAALSPSHDDKEIR